MAGPSKVEFPGQKKQRMRARGTKRASAGVLKRLEKNLSVLLDDPHSVMPVVAYSTDRGLLSWLRRLFRKDPVKKSLNECGNVIARKNDCKWLSKRMTKKIGDLPARALAGSLHAAHDDERSMVAVFDHPIFGNSSFVRRGLAKPTHLVSFQNHGHPRQRLLAWEEHAKSGWWFFSMEEGGIICTGREARPPEGWLEGGLSDAPMEFTQRDGVHCSPSASPDQEEGIHFIVGDSHIILAEADLAGVGEEESVPRSVAFRMMPPRLVDFATVEWNWRPDGWPEDKDLPAICQERVEEIIEAWLNLSVTDSQLTKALRK
mgnify:FL=1